MSRKSARTKKKMANKLVKNNETKVTNKPVEDVVENTNTNESTGTNYLVTAGDGSCYVYFDTEFTTLSKNSELISIGLVDSDGRTFYAEFNDYNEKKVNDWVFENVYKNLDYPDTILEGNNWTITGTKAEVRTQLMLWLDKFVSKNKPVQFVSDVCHYDFVLLVDLLTGGATAMDLPKWVVPCCLDLNQDISTTLYRNIPEGVTEEEFNKNYIPLATAFDINREECVKDLTGFDEPVKKHNALYDAKVIRAIHRHIWNIK